MTGIVTVLALLVSQVMATPPGAVLVRVDAVSGSGVCVGIVKDRPIILTANHVITESAKDIAVLWSVPNAEGDYVVIIEVKGRVVARAPTEDLALIELLGESLRPSVVTVAAGRPTVGDHVTMLHCPRGWANTAGFGRVTFVGRWSEGQSWDQTDIIVQPGSSGGPLLNGKGELLGIVVSSTGPITWVVPSRRIKPFLDAVGVK